MFSITFKVNEDHTEEFKRIIKLATDRALEAVGLKAEGYAKKKCPVDTGYLRNSITHAVSGKEFSHNWKANKGDRSGSVSAVIGSEDDKEAYIGTAVEYASYVEYGTSRTRPQPFIKPAAESHAEEYKRIFEMYYLNADG